jgi:hypothetical protein
VLAAEAFLAVLHTVIDRTAAGAAETALATAVHRRAALGLFAAVLAEDYVSRAVKAVGVSEATFGRASKLTRDSRVELHCQMFALCEHACKGKSTQSAKSPGGLI